MDLSGFFFSDCFHKPFSVAVGGWCSQTHAKCHKPSQNYCVKCPKQQPHSPSCSLPSWACWCTPSWCFHKEHLHCCYCCCWCCWAKLNCRSPSTWHSRTTVSWADTRCQQAPRATKCLATVHWLTLAKSTMTSAGALWWRRRSEPTCDAGDSFHSNC